MLDKFAQGKIIELTTLLEQIREIKGQSHCLNNVPNVDPLPSFYGVEYENPQRTKEKLQIKFFFDIPLDFDNLSTCQRENRFS
jgi:hypothetical protein